MATGFEDDYAISTGGEEKKTGVELTEREKAIAQGRDPSKEAEDESDDSVGGDGDSEDEADDKEVDGKEAAASDSDWVDDSVKELADSLGIDEETLGSFENEGDFKKFAAILEKNVGKAEPKADKKDENQPPSGGISSSDMEDIDVKHYEDEGFDDNTLNIVKSVAKLQGLVKELTTRNAQLESRLVEDGARRERDLLHKEIDELGGRFGKSESLSGPERKAREKLIDAIDVVKQTLEKRGEKASSKAVLRRAELVAFGDEILAEEKAKQKEALEQSVRKQSAKRRSVGRNTKPPSRGDRPGEARNPVKAISNDPRIVEFWNNAQD